MEEKVHFSPVPDNVSLAILEGLEKSQEEITFWEKGDSSKHYFKKNKFSKEKNELIIFNDSKIELNKTKNYLISFSNKGTYYFAKTKVGESIKDSYFSLIFEGPIYKCERRSNFRLKLYAGDNVNIYLRFLPKAIEEDQAFLPDDRETKIFKMFLNEMRVSDRVAEAEKGEELNFIVRDISVSGLSFWTSHREAKLFKKSQCFDNTLLRFSDDEARIPKMKVVYIEPLKDEVKREFSQAINNDKIEYQDHDYKVGCEFETLDQNLDVWFQKKINAKMRELADFMEFEDFIK